MRVLIFLTVLIPMMAFTQVRDDFSDGDFNSKPSWTGDTSAFTVNSQHQLQLYSSGSDTSCLFTPGISLADMEWSFWIKMSFNTSLNNYARIYLGSDSPDLKRSINAVYLQMGGSGDSLVLFRKNGAINTPILKLPVLRTNHSINIFRIKICRDSAGTWDFYADSTGGHTFTRFGCFNDKAAVPSACLGVFCRYTSSNSNKFWFDDFYMGGIIHDTIPPGLISVGFSDSLTIRIKFTEPIDSTCLDKDLDFSLKNSPEKILKAYIIKDEPSIIYIRINAGENDFYCDTLEIKNISDYSDNILMDTSVYFCYYIPGSAKPGDLIINEVLFYPDAAGSRFIEFFNRSFKVVDLSTLSVGAEGGSQTAKKYEALCKTERMLYPGDYYVITADSAKLCSRYYTPDRGKIEGDEHFPSMDSDSGSVCLISNVDSLLLDEMRYNQNMHLPFLASTKGVSLERLNPQLPSNSRSSWQSASETSGFASPGYENSHYAVEPGNGIDLQLSSSVISPDNDGREDLLYIRVNGVEAGTLLTLRIFDIKGNMVKTIAGPSTVSEDTLFIWDGTADNNLRVPMGYYLVFSESISSSGKHSRVKKAVVVAQKL